MPRLDHGAYAVGIKMDLEQNAQVVHESGDEGVRGQVDAGGSREPLGSRRGGETVQEQASDVEARRPETRGHGPVQTNGSGNPADRI